MTYKIYQSRFKKSSLMSSEASVSFPKLASSTYPAFVIFQRELGRDRGPRENHSFRRPISPHNFLSLSLSLSLSKTHLVSFSLCNCLQSSRYKKPLSLSLSLLSLSLLSLPLLSLSLSLSHSIVRSTFLKWCNRQKKKKKCNRQLFVWAEAATWRMLKILRRIRKWKISLSDNFERRVGQLFRLELLNLKKAFDESGRDVRRRPDGGAGPQIYYNFFAPSLRAP